MRIVCCVPPKGHVIVAWFNFLQWHEICSQLFSLLLHLQLILGGGRKNEIIFIQNYQLSKFRNINFILTNFIAIYFYLHQDIIFDIKHQAYWRQSRKIRKLTYLELSTRVGMSNRSVTKHLNNTRSRKNLRTC